MAVAAAAAALTASASGQSVARLAFPLGQHDPWRVRSLKRLMRRFWLGKDEPSVSEIFPAESDLERYFGVAGQVAGKAETVGRFCPSCVVFPGHP